MQQEYLFREEVVFGKIAAFSVSQTFFFVLGLTAK
jgi:hypothetical protein